MALGIKIGEADQLAPQAEHYGVVDPPQRETLLSLRRRWAALPVLDDRSADELLCYDEDGLPR